MLDFEGGGFLGLAVEADSARLQRLGTEKGPNNPRVCPWSFQVSSRNVKDFCYRGAGAGLRMGGVETSCKSRDDGNVLRCLSPWSQQEQVTNFYHI